MDMEKSARRPRQFLSANGPASCIAEYPDPKTKRIDSIAPRARPQRAPLEPSPAHTSSFWGGYTAALEAMQSPNSPDGSDRLVSFPTLAAAVPPPAAKPCYYNNPALYEISIRYDAWRTTASPAAVRKLERGKLKFTTKLPSPHTQPLTPVNAG